MIADWAIMKSREGVALNYYGSSSFQTTLLAADLDAHKLSLELERTTRVIRPWVLLKTKTIDGEEIRLCDFATAGAYGNAYRTWLPIRNLKAFVFDRNSSIWNNRP